MSLGPEAGQGEVELPPPATAATDDLTVVAGQLEEFSEAFEQMCVEVTQGMETTKFALQFIEKWSRIEQQYSKSLEELCTSSVCKKSCQQEPVPELTNAWGTFVAELQHFGLSRAEMVTGVRETLVTQLTTFVKDTLQHQTGRMTEGRKSLRELKAILLKLQKSQEKFHILCQETAEEVALTSAAYFPVSFSHAQMMLPTESEKDARSQLPGVQLSPPPAAVMANLHAMTPPLARRLAESQSPSVQKALKVKQQGSKAFNAELQQYLQQQDKCFTETLPRLLTAMRDVEVQRVSYVKHAVGHAITGMTYSVRQSFERSLTTLQAVTPRIIETCQVEAMVPSSPAYSEQPLSINVDAPRRPVLELNRRSSGQEPLVLKISPQANDASDTTSSDAVCIRSSSVSVDVDSQRPRMMSAV